MQTIVMDWEKVQKWMHDEGKEVECISEISFLLDVIYFSGKKEPAGFYYNMYA